MRQKEVVNCHSTQLIVTLHGTSPLECFLQLYGNMRYGSSEFRRRENLTGFVNIWWVINKLKFPSELNFPSNWSIRNPVLLSN